MAPGLATGISSLILLFALLPAARYDPVRAHGAKAPPDFVFVLAAFLALQFWKLCPW